MKAEPVPSRMHCDRHGKATNPGGFLLVEVVLAMSILVLAALGVYKIMQAALETTAEVRRSHLREEEINGVVTLLRQTFRSLPGDASITSRAPQGAAGVELVIGKSPAAFALGPDAFHFGSHVLSPQQQIGGLLNLSLIFEPELSPTGEPVRTDQVLPPPLPLIDDLRGVEWRFYDERTARWVEQWNEPTVRPRLIQFTMGIAGQPNPLVAVFWLAPWSEDAKPPSARGRRSPRSDEEGEGTPPQPPPQAPAQPTPPTGVIQVR